MVEESAYEVESEFPKVLPVAFVKMLKSLQRNADSYPSQNEAGTSNFHSSLVSIISYFFGGDLFNAKALAAMVNVDPADADETDLDFWNQLDRINWEDVDRAYLMLPVPVIVAMATFLRGSAAGPLRHLGVNTLAESEVDVLCVVFAPPLVCMVGLFHEQICEPGRAVLAPVLSPMSAESEEENVLPSSAGGWLSFELLGYGRSVAAVPATGRSPAVARVGAPPAVVVRLSGPVGPHPGADFGVAPLGRKEVLAFFDGDEPVGDQLVRRALEGLADLGPEALVPHGRRGRSERRPLRRDPRRGARP